MKFLKVLYRILILIVIIFILLFAWRWLQKESVIITNSTKSVIAKLQSVNKLESAEMTITKIMRSEKGLVDIIPNISIDNTIQDFLFQDKMIFEVE
jgi:TATA-box binding protein (TBP) (component of TFIID and TFIIIB)